MRLKNSSVSGESAAPPEMKAQNFQPKRRWMRRKSQARRRNFLFSAARKVLSSQDLACGDSETCEVRALAALSTTCGASRWSCVGGATHPSREAEARMVDHPGRS